MSDQHNMDDDIDDPQHAAPEIETAENDSLSGDDEVEMTMPDLSNDEEDRVTHSSENAHVQAPNKLGAEDSQDIAAQIMDAAQCPAAQRVEVSQEEVADHNNHDITQDSDDNMGEDQYYDEEDVIESVEQELGLESGSLGPSRFDADMDEVEEDAQKYDDVNMAKTNAGKDQVEPSAVIDSRKEVNHEEEDHGEPMHGLQDVTEVPPNNTPTESSPQQQGASKFRSVHAEDGQLEDDPASLFIPDRPSPATRTPLHQGPTMNMPPPSRPPAPTSKGGMSMFEKIRNMQKANVERKNAIDKQTKASQYVTEPDNETYLEAVMSTIKPSASTAAPAVDEDEMAHRQALAEYQRQQRHYTELKRKNGGQLTFRQGVEWLKIQGAETARKKKRARDVAKASDDAEDDTELFPEVYPRPDADEEDDSDDAFNFDASASSRKRRWEMPRKEPKRFSMQEAEYQSMKVALEASDDFPKKKRKSQPADDDSRDTRASGKGKATKAKSKATKSKTVSKPSVKGPRKTAKAKRETANALKQASSLFGANVFDQQAGADAREQPTFRSRNKQDALKELIASCPIEDKKQARSDMAVVLAATKDFDGRGSVKAVDGNWLVKGMKTSLKGYQILGSAFMRRRENAAEEPRGGLMADQMGLGKTLMMLANIVNGQPPRGQHPRTTLLVASPSLLTQWGKEIEQHTKCGLRIMKYGSGNRLDSNHAFDILKGHDIILTTYGEIMKSYPKNEPPVECHTVQQKLDWWKTQFETRRGVLHRMMFLRVVLDEAQAIKNHMGRTSIACRALIAQHKWALSGTPIMNNLTELYPYFKFLGVPHTGSFKIFKHNYCDTKDAKNTERLLVRLSQFMIRRTHADMLFNAPILKLPQADQGTFWCQFNPVERCIYDIVQQRFAKNINMWQAKGELEKCYSNALVMLLRLRQLTAHVLMLQFVMRDLLEIEDIECIKNVVQEQSADSHSPEGRTIIAIRKQLEKHAIEQKKKAAAKAAAKASAQAAREEYVEEEVLEEESQEPAEAFGPSTAQEGSGIGGSGQDFGKTYNFKPFLNSLKTGESWEKAKKKAKCSYCEKAPKKPWIASCGHLICAEPCMEEAGIAAAEDEKSYSPCGSCGITPTSIHPCDFEEEPPETIAGNTRSRARNTARQRERRDREDIAEDWLSLAGAEVLPSAKTLAIKAQILNWRREDRKVKIIIYTQFLAM